MFRSLLITASFVVGGKAFVFDFEFDDDDDDDITSPVGYNGTASDQGNNNDNVSGNLCVSIVFLFLCLFLMILMVRCIRYYQGQSNMTHRSAASRRPSLVQLPSSSSLPVIVMKKEGNAAAAAKRLNMLKERFNQADLQKVLQAHDFEVHGVDEEKGRAAKVVPGEPNTSSTMDQNDFTACLEESNNCSLPSNRLVRLTPTQTAPSCCAICLNEYTTGETLVWSNNPACRHAFHHDCMLDWLVKITATGSEQCPCCRQMFIDLQ